MVTILFQLGITHLGIMAGFIEMTVLILRSARTMSIQMDITWGFLENGEWMQYDVDVKSGVYDILVRVASAGSGGRFHFSSGNADVTPTTFAPPTGDWQNWESIVISNVIMDSTDTKLRMHVDQPGFNISSFEFIETEIELSSLATEFVAAETIDEYTIQMNANKFIEGPLPSAPDGFEIFVDGK